MDAWMHAWRDGRMEGRLMDQRMHEFMCAWIAKALSYGKQASRRMSQREGAEIRATFEQRYPSAGAGGNCSASARLAAACTPLRARGRTFPQTARQLSTLFGLQVVLCCRTEGWLARRRGQRRSACVAKGPHKRRTALDSVHVPSAPPRQWMSLRVSPRAVQLPLPLLRLLLRLLLLRLLLRLLLLVLRLPRRLLVLVSPPIAADMLMARLRVCCLPRSASTPQRALCPSARRVQAVPPPMRHAAQRFMQLPTRMLTRHPMHSHVVIHARQADQAMYPAGEGGQRRRRPPRACAAAAVWPHASRTARSAPRRGSHASVAVRSGVRVRAATALMHAPRGRRLKGGTVG
eukprot:145573-Chlamydomonas_euryale.AAC.15